MYLYLTASSQIEYECTEVKHVQVDEGYWSYISVCVGIKNCRWDILASTERIPIDRYRRTGIGNVLQLSFGAGVWLELGWSWGWNCNGCVGVWLGFAWDGWRGAYAYFDQGGEGGWILDSQSHMGIWNVADGAWVWKDHGNRDWKCKVLAVSL